MAFTAYCLCQLTFPFTGLDLVNQDVHWSLDENDFAILSFARHCARRSLTSNRLCYSNIFIGFFFFFFAFRILVKIHVHTDDKFWKSRGIVILKYSTNIQWYVTLLRICFYVNYVCEIIMRCNVNLNVDTYT